jgi:hypothetical protein
VWNYAACLEQETNPRIKAMWERFLDYELGHLQVAMHLFKDIERRDPAEVLGDGKLPPFIQFESQREFRAQGARLLQCLLVCGWLCSFWRRLHKLLPRKPMRRDA